ncbi:MAG: class I tRNA ligase family protein [Desulfosalsimonadaceae bacterium]
MSSELHLYNTLTRRKERFAPREEGKTVKMFTCGPSIYAWPHIGNYRTFLFEDILQRYLTYLGYTVQRVINFTDVEDKAISQAVKSGVSLDELTKPVARRFKADCRLLDIALPETIPRSSTCVEQAVYLIEKLLEKGVAYRHGRDIFYDPLKFRGFGKLFGLDMRRWPKKKVRFRKDTYPGKRWNRGDFILWKGRREEDGSVYWKTPLGEGRPAWNIQDPAMISRHMGYTTDIWCGGVDNLYRHHDYNIAVLEAVSGQTLSRFWLHGEHVLAGKKKMSKSTGNIVYVQDLLDTGFSPHHIRFFLIYGHFQEQIDINEDRLHMARGKVDTLRDMTHQLENGQAAGGDAAPGAEDRIRQMTRAFEGRMNDNLDVKNAFDAVYDIASTLLKMKNKGGLTPEEGRHAARELRRIDRVWRVLG